MGEKIKQMLLILLAALLIGAAAEVVAVAHMRTTAPDLKTSQGAASVFENLRTLARTVLNHQHRGDDGTSRLRDPFIDGDVVLQSADGDCWSCGPDNSGNWACASTPCPS